MGNLPCIRFAFSPPGRQDLHPGPVTNRSRRGPCPHVPVRQRAGLTQDGRFRRIRSLPVVASSFREGAVASRPRLTSASRPPPAHRAMNDSTPFFECGPLKPFGEVLAVLCRPVVAFRVDRKSRRSSTDRCLKTISNGSIRPAELGRIGSPLEGLPSWGDRHRWGRQSEYPERSKQHARPVGCGDPLDATVNTRPRQNTRLSARDRLYAFGHRCSVRMVGRQR
ncbi:hypothetical protein J2W76_004163 [Methylorubrum zatmanii]|nr:hypothetical protein [Methylorubrum zatmanii]MCP1552469.1 hypothetical protein [Methylorubrum extorquens]MCP1581221.1 hypothetical protein [Methylorubrum extorquens]